MDILACAPPMTQDDKILTGLEAARYALLMRIAPALRHGLLGQMQAIHFLTEIAVRQQRAGKSPEQLGESIGKMPQQATVALDRCNRLTRWLKADTDEIASLASIMEEARELVDVEFSLHNRRVVVEPCDPALLGPRTATLEALVGSLLALADQTKDVGEFRLVATALGEGSVVNVATHLAPGGDPEGPQSYRNITWPDVTALARARGVTVDLTATGVQLCLPARSAMAP